MALKLFVTLCTAQPTAAQQVVDAVLPPALTLVRSPLLQGAALSELQAVFPALAATGAPSAKTDVLLKMLLERGRCRGAGAWGCVLHTHTCMACVLHRPAHGMAGIVADHTHTRARARKHTNTLQHPQAARQHLWR